MLGHVQGERALARLAHGHTGEETLEEIYDRPGAFHRPYLPDEAPAGSEGGQGSLDGLLREYDRYSIREFLTMRGFSEGALELYGVMSFLAAAFVYLYVPETKQRTLEEIQNLWTGHGAGATAAVKQPAAS